MLLQPLELYRVFVVEQRFGFNQTSLGTYVIDRLNNAVLLLLLGWPVVIVVGIDRPKPGFIGLVGWSDKEKVAGEPTRESLNPSGQSHQFIWFVVLGLDNLNCTHTIVVMIALCWSQ